MLVAFADVRDYLHELSFEAGDVLAKSGSALEQDQLLLVTDGLVEAIKGTGRTFLCGVQWHPEFHPPGAADLLDCTPILDEFLAAVRGRRW